jgi:large subunit ribosomal protein L3
MKFIIGYKQQMTQQYREDGTLVPVTVVKAEPAIVTQVKSVEKDGYQAVQLGIGKKNKVNKSMAGHLKTISAKHEKPFATLQEIRLQDSTDFEVGDTINVKTFEAGDVVAVTGTSKGKGFQGVVKRHGFKGSPASHGHKDQLRMPGSIGAQDAQRVFKGMKMGGRMGGDQVTVKNLEIVSLDEENNLLYVKGAVPGARNGLIVIMGEGDLTKGVNILAASESTPAEKPTETKEEKAETPKEETSVEEPAKTEVPEEKVAKAEPKKEESK